MKKGYLIFWGLALTVLITHCSTKDGMYYNTLRSDVFVQTADTSKYDFLFVFDTSGSFAPRRNYVRDNIQTFINTLNQYKAADYQIAMTTVDMFGGVSPALADTAGVRGNILASPTGLQLVKSSAANPVADFASIINNIQQSDTSFWEQGLEGMYQAISQHASIFSRPGVPLIVIPMSDSDDWSCQGNCYGVQPEQNNSWVPFPLSRYSSLLQNYQINNGADVTFFPIVGLPSSACSVEFPGTRYMAVQQALGGLSQSFSVCQSDLGTSLNGVAQIIANRGTVFKLSNASTGSGFSVYVNGQLVENSPDNYIFNQSSNSIIFTGYVPPKGASVEIVYSAK